MFLLQGAAGEELPGPSGLRADGVGPGRGSPLRAGRGAGPAVRQLQDGGPTLTPQMDSPGAAGRSYHQGSWGYSHVREWMT